MSTDHGSSLKGRSRKKFLLDVNQVLREGSLPFPLLRLCSLVFFKFGPSNVFCSKEPLSSFLDGLTFFLVVTKK